MVHRIVVLVDVVFLVVDVEDVVGSFLMLKIHVNLIEDGTIISLSPAVWCEAHIINGNVRVPGSADSGLDDDLELLAADQLHLVPHPLVDIHVLDPVVMVDARHVPVPRGSDVHGQVAEAVPVHVREEPH